MDQELEGLRAEQVLAGVQLDLAAAVAEVEEGGLAVAAAADDPAGDAVAGLGLDPGRQALVGGAHLGDVLAFAEAVREGVDARPRGSARASARRSRRTSESFGSLGLALRSARAYPTAQAVSILVIFSFFFGPRGTSTVTTSLRLWPISALPIGDSLESLCSSGSASVDADDLEFLRVAGSSGL